MTPSGLQVPSTPVGASQILVGGPPVTSIFISFPSATNPRNRLSGDQNGRRVRSVPGSGCGVSAPSGLSQIWVLPLVSVSLNARIFPSGEILGASIVTTLGGLATSNRTRGGGLGARLG